MQFLRWLLLTSFILECVCHALALAAFDHQLSNQGHELAILPDICLHIGHGPSAMHVAEWP
jgi:hypothetical protein